MFAFITVDRGVIRFIAKPFKSYIALRWVNTMACSHVIAERLVSLERRFAAIRGTVASEYSIYKRANRDLPRCFDVRVGDTHFADKLAEADSPGSAAARC